MATTSLPASDAALATHRKVVVHEASTTGLPPLRPYLAETWRRRPFIWHLARTQLKGEHYDTVMGQVWLLLNPMLLAAVYLLVRAVLRPPSGEDIPMIMANLVMSIFFFRFVSGGASSGARTIVSNRGMMLNTPFPRVVFPAIVVIKQIMEFLPAIAVLLVVHVILDQPWGFGMFWLPYLVLFQLIMMFGIALLAAPAPVLLPDTSSIIPYLTRIWLYATPVLYMVSEIPDNLLPYLRWNPLFPSFAALEAIFQGGTPTRGDLLATMAWAVGFFVIGAWVFLSKERKLAARL